jgi:hypothetical protein
MRPLICLIFRAWRLATTFWGVVRMLDRRIAMENPNNELADLERSGSRRPLRTRDPTNLVFVEVYFLHTIPLLKVVVETKRLTSIPVHILMRPNFISEQPRAYSLQGGEHMAIKRLQFVGLGGRDQRILPILSLLSRADALIMN